MGASDLSPGSRARNEERPYWEAPKGLVQVLKGARLLFGARAYLLTVEEAGEGDGEARRGRKDLRSHTEQGSPAFCQSEKPVGQTALGWAVNSKKSGSQKW